MAEDFSITGTHLKRVMDFVGKAGVVSPSNKIPDTEGPIYSQHGDLTNLVDGMSLEQAIATLDTPPQVVNFAYASLFKSPPGFAFVNLTFTRDQPILIIGKVFRRSTRQLTLNINKPLSVSGTVNSAGKVTSTGTFNYTGQHNIWTDERTAFTILNDGVEVAKTSVLQAEGEVNILGVASSGTGVKQVRIALDSGPLGDLITSRIFVIGIGSF